MFEFYESPDKEEKMIIVNEVVSSCGEYIMAICYYTTSSRIDIFFFSKIDLIGVKSDFNKVSEYPNYEMIVTKAIFFKDNIRTIRDYIK